MQMNKMFDHGQLVYYADPYKIEVIPVKYIYCHPYHVLCENNFSGDVVKKFCLPFDEKEDLSNYIFETKEAAYERLIDNENNKIEKHLYTIRDLKVRSNINRIVRISLSDFFKMMEHCKYACTDGIILYAWNESKENFKHAKIIGWLNVNGGRYVDVDGNHYEHVGDV